MKPYIKKSHSVSYKNTPLTYSNAYGWRGQVKTNSCIFICSFGGNLNGNRTKVGNNIYLVTNSDYHTYCKSIGVKPSTLYLYIHSPDAISEDDASYTENVMDCCMCCMNQCTIVLSIFPQTNDFYDCFQTMLPGYTVNGTLLKPTQISISWGCPENQISSNDRYLLPGLIQSCGVPVFVAAGDDNATDGTPGLMVDFPASCPYLISVGGTTITSMNPFKEKVWNHDGSGTGGGYSQIFSKPSYQTCSGNKRAVPDICAVSDPDTGIRLCINGVMSYGFGGTSMAAPYICSMYGIFQSNYGIKVPVYSFLYKVNCFNDITSGNNKTNKLGYTATKGYDLCSGLGSIQWDKLVNYLSKSITPKPKISIKLQLHKSYPFLPIQHNSSALIIKNNKIRASKLGNYIVSTPRFLFHINVVRNTNVRFALTT